MNELERAQKCGVVIHRVLVDVDKRMEFLARNYDYNNYSTTSPRISSNNKMKGTSTSMLMHYVASIFIPS